MSNPEVTWHPQHAAEPRGAAGIERHPSVTFWLEERLAVESPRAAAADQQGGLA